MRWNAASPSPGSENRFVWLVPVILLYWAVGFYPFQFQSPITFHTNAADHVSAHALDFSEPGIGYTSNAPEWLMTAIQSQSLQIQLNVQAHKSQQFGPARILSISKDTLKRNLTLGQQGTDLVLRLRRSGSSANGTPAYTVSSVFARPGWRHIELEITAARLRLSVDGQRRLDEALADDPFALWATDYRLALGNEFSFDRPWLGGIRRAEISVPGTSLDYAATSAELAVPDIYPVPRPNMRFGTKLPFLDDQATWSTWQDWLINLFGFLPFGLLLAALSPASRPVLFAAVLSASLSLSIELTQFFFAGRHPELDDLILNTLGGLAGTWLGCRIRLCQQPKLALGSVDA